MAKTIWDYLTDAGETMATLGTGAVAPFAGGAYGIYKGVTSPGYGTIQGGREADRAAIEMTNRLTYQPRGEATRGLLGAVGGAVGGAADFLKLPPVLPEAAILGALGLNNNAIMSQTQRGMQAAKPMVGNAMEGYMARTGLAPRMMPESPAMPTTPTAPVSPAGFYSAAEQAALNLPRNKGTGQALLNDLMKGADVKQDELQATGVLDAFANRPQATKQELVDFLQANRIEVGQTVKASQNPYPYKSAVEWQNAIFDAENNGNWGLADQISTAWEQYDGAVPSPKIPRYESYTMPGGENYREVLLTLPMEKPTVSKYAALKGITESEAIADRTGFLQWRTEQLSNNKTPYQSSHWDEPNVMAHLRLNDRVDVDGKKMTMIEEVQSDWHQAGREKGYGPKMEDSVEAYYVTEDGQRIQIGFGTTKEDAIKYIDPGWKHLVDIKYETQTRKIGEGVPDAPMKDTWYQTALRKAVKDAIDSGSDRVGIPTGGLQAERYGQAKKINEISVYTPQEDGTRTIGFQTEGGSSVSVMIDPSGKIVSGQSNMVQEFVGKTLEEMVGKDAATKVLGYGVGKTAFPVQNVTIGGKGMKKYYDEVYPKYLDKFAKKYGSKVSEGGVAQAPKSASEVLEFTGGQKYANGQITWNELVELNPSLKNQFQEPVRYIDITPAMRKALGGKDKGVPLFQAAPLIPAGVAGSSGLLDQFGESEQ
jgi:hypothetical protein